MSYCDIESVRLRGLPHAKLGSFVWSTLNIWMHHVNTSRSSQTKY